MRWNSCRDRQQPDNYMEGDLTMKYTVNVYEVSTEKDKGLRGFAAVTFSDSFKVTGITIREKQKGGLYIKMPKYPTGERDEDNRPVYNNVCFSKTTEFRTELERNILETYEGRTDGKNKSDYELGTENLDYYLQVVNNKDRGSSTKAYVRLVIQDAFVINQITIKRSIAQNNFVAMPSQRRMIDGKTDYQDICFPVTKDFREQLYGEILEKYTQNLEKMQSAAKEKAR